jgi:NhaP-type Na+/H+ or K+/H+ antiporter
LTDSAFYHAALAVALGMIAQVVGLRLSVPSIVILLATGVAVGPDGLGLLQPAVFGSALSHLVTLAVTVILFEGGLALRVEDLRQQHRSRVHPPTVGALISMTVGMLAARSLLGMSWSIAWLYGTLVIVTGPTVVTPLLTRLTLNRRVRELLISEGVLIDPVGAIVAIVAAEYVVGHSAIWEAGWLVFARLGVGAVLGAVAGLALGFVLRRRWVPEDLRNPTVLGLVLVVAAVASRVSSEAGLMAAATQGVVMANLGLRELGSLRQFKEELTVLLLSFIFVLLAADLPLGAVRALGWNALLVVAVLVGIGRPLAVLLCTVGSGLSWREKLFISWICPRGVVAASVAGLFGILLAKAGILGGERLQALVFITVAATVTVQGLTAGLVARLLGLDTPVLQGTLIVGADDFGRLIARLLGALQRQAMLVDSNPRHCRKARTHGLIAHLGDARSADTLETAGVRYADTVVALTANEELNTLVAQEVRNNFRVERILAAASGPVVDDERRSAEARPFPGNFPGPEEVDHALSLRRATLVTYQVPEKQADFGTLGELDYGAGEFALLLGRRDSIFVAATDQKLLPGDRLLCLQVGNGDSPLRSILSMIQESDPNEALAVVNEAAAATRA